jgi:hypothetical protein
VETGIRYPKMPAGAPRSRAFNRQRVKRTSLRYCMVVPPWIDPAIGNAFRLCRLMRHLRNRKRWEEDDNQRGSFFRRRNFSFGSNGVIGQIPSSEGQNILAIP